MSYSNIILSTDDDATTMASRLNFQTNDGHGNLVKLINYLRGCVGGAYGGVTVTMAQGAVRATGSGTFTGAPTAAQTMTINGVTFTARASGAVADEYNIGASVTATAANLAAAVNASTSAGVQGITASSSAGVVTFTADVPGLAGNAFTLVDVNTANFTFAASPMSGGTAGTVTTFTVNQ